MKISKQGLQEIQNSEKCKLKAYKCPAGRWTVGWGQTGEDIVEGTEWTQEKADAARDATVAGVEKAVTKALTRAATQAQFDAMCSLTYNIGKYAFATSTVLRQHNAGNTKDAAAAFLMWNKITVNGVLTYSAGLNNRRHREKALYLTVKEAVVPEKEPAKDVDKAKAAA